MTIQIVNVGSNPNDGSGDDLRTAFLKVNNNFEFLAEVVGGTSDGANVGNAIGEVFARKLDDTLFFRTLSAGNDGISITQSGDVISISNTFSTPNSFSRIFIGDTSNSVQALNPGDSFRIRSEGAVQLGAIGNTITITGVFNLSDDSLPSLSGNLNLSSNNIIGTGNIDILGNIISNNLTVGRSTGPGNWPGLAVINGTLTVNSSTTLQSLSATSISASTSITAPNITATNTLTGNLLGTTTGTHYGNVAIKGQGLDPDIIAVNTAASPATFTGNLFGNVSGGFTGNLISGGLNFNSQTLSGEGFINISGSEINLNHPLIVNAVSYKPIELEDQEPQPDDGYASALFTSVLQPGGTSITESLRLRSVSLNSSQTLPLGTGIMFESQNIIDEELTSLDIDGNIVPFDPLNPPTQKPFIRHGYLGILNYKEFGISEDPLALDDSYSSFVVKVRNKTDEELIPSLLDDLAWLRDIIIARGDGRVTISLLDLDKTTIKPSKVLDDSGSVVDLDFDLIITNKKNNRYINFYGDYGGFTTDPSTGERTAIAIGGYSFPKQIGAPGQVLSPVIGTNILEWINPPSGGEGGGLSTFLNLTDTPSTYLPTDAGKLIRVNSSFNGLEFTNSINATVTGSLIGNSSTATALQTARLINGKTFNGTQNIELTTNDISEDQKLFFTVERVRNSISVEPDTSLTYDAETGTFNIFEDVINTANSLVKRDEEGTVFLNKVRLVSLEKIDTFSSISINSPVVTDQTFTSSNSITTTGSLSAGFITLTGTGNQTLTSTDKIILNPATSVDVSGKKIINLPITAPTNDTDAATKKYVDDKSSDVLTASIQNIPISGDTGGVLSVNKNSTLNITGSTNISTNTTGSGVQVNLKSLISGITISGNLPVTGQLTANSVRGGNIVLTANSVTQNTNSADLNLIPGINGGSVVVSGGDLRLSNSRLIITGSDIAEFAANTLEQQISLTTAVTFIRTLNWVDTNANLAFAELPNGQLGQIKTIIMRDRGTFGDALDTRPRYLVLRGNINGSSRTVNIAQNDANGSSTFIFLDNFWWRISHVS
jgi:hypothetical protein